MALHGILGWNKQIQNICDIVMLCVVNFKNLKWKIDSFMMLKRLAAVCEFKRN